jgi:hypothetical protein
MGTPTQRAVQKAKKKRRRAGNESLEIRAGVIRMQDCGDGPQLVSALAQHFEMAVDQIEYRLQLSAEATRMFQATGINQITCDV